MSAELEESQNSAAAAALTAGNGGEEEEEEDMPMLSSQALAALREFLVEQSSSRSEASRGENEGEAEEVQLVAEDWRLSQFWYDRETGETVAQEIMTLCRSTPSQVACISCPTIYAYLKKLDPDMPVQLLEYDKRFEQYGSNFTFYDYNQPENLPPELKHGFRVIVADPPYLSRDCLDKVSQTISYLAQPQEMRLLFLTGAVQEESAAELLNAYPCIFRPQHSNKLGNEFRLFTNYDPAGRLGGWEPGRVKISHVSC